MPPSTLRPGLTLLEAYDVQRINLARRVAEGEHPVGHKVGLTSKAMQDQLGVDQPDYGVITDAMVIVDGGVLELQELVAPRVEAEFAFRIGHSLPANPTVEELGHAIDGVSLALEIIDSRVADWKITLADTVADNASSARIVYGAFAPANRGLLRDLPATTITLRRDAEAVSSGPGSAVLGDPLMSLHWLATAIGAHGDHFSAGDIVLAGAVAAAAPLEGSATWEAHATGLAAVTLNVESNRNQ